MDHAADRHHLDQLRRHRNRADQDLSLQFLQKQFDREVARPFKQLAGLAEIWRRHVPAHLAPHTSLEGLDRGVLRVAVDSSAHHYELSQLLREGLQRQLITEHTGPAIRRIVIRQRHPGR